MPAPIEPAIFFEWASVKMGVSLLHRHRAINWYAFGVACSG